MEKVVKRDLSNVYKEVKDSLFECKIMNENIRNAKYHHNAKFFQGPSIIKSGILSLDEQRKLEGRKITEREKNILSDECYVNGSEYISISSGILIMNIYQKKNLYIILLYLTFWIY